MRETTAVPGQEEMGNLRPPSFSLWLERFFLSQGYGSVGYGWFCTLGDLVEGRKSRGLGRGNQGESPGRPTPKSNEGSTKSGAGSDTTGKSTPKFNEGSAKSGVGWFNFDII